MGTRRRAWAMLVLCGGVAVLTSASQAQQVSKLTSIMDWSLYTDGKSPHLFCFITSEPKSSAPPETPRELPRVYVSAWPKDGVKGELSIRLGFPAKKGTDISAAVGTTAFKLFASDERAFVQDATSELKLLEAMRKGSKLTVTATTATGTEVTDTYSLSGLGQALGELQSTCF
jgi:hypothetical protein